MAQNVHLKDRIAQIVRTIESISRDALGGHDDAWIKVDGQIRLLQEHVSSLIVYAIKGDVDGKNLLGKSYTRKVVNKAKNLLKTTGCPNQNIIDWFSDDISAHNVNSHGTSDLVTEKVELGKANLVDSVPKMIQLFESGLESTGLFDNKGVVNELSTMAERLKVIWSFMNRNDISQASHVEVSRLLTESFGQTSLPETDAFIYVLIVPDKIEDVLAETILMLISSGISVIVDSGHKDGKLYRDASEIMPQLIHDTALQSRFASTLTNWFFPNGRVGTEPQRDIRANIRALEKSPLPPKNLLIINLDEDTSVSYRIIRQIWDFVAAEEKREPADNTILLTPKVKDGDTLKVMFEADGYKLNRIEEYDLQPIEFLKALSGYFMATDVQDIPIAAIPVTDERVYLDAGIKFLGSASAKRRTIWDGFYTGQELTIEDIQTGRDVYPRANKGNYDSFMKSLRNAIYNIGSTEFLISHEPGAGGTTLCRHMVYDLMESKGPLEYQPVFVSHFNASTTVDMLSKLSYSMRGCRRLLVVTDDKDMSTIDYTFLKSKLSTVGTQPVYLRVQHSTQNVAPGQKVLQLASTITKKTEIQHFDSCFQNAYRDHMTKEKIDGVISNIKGTADNGGIEMIYYPYAFIESMANDTGEGYEFLDSSSYVKDWFGAIKDENLRNLSRNIAFVYLFTASKSTDIFSLASIWRDDKHLTVNSYEKSDLRAFRKLIKTSDEGNGIASLMAPRYGAFARKILEVSDSVWNHQLPDFAVNFIRSYSPELRERDREVFLDLFIYQSRYDYKSTEALASNDIGLKFSALIGRIISEDKSAMGARKVFDALVSEYTDEPLFKAHYARFLFEYACSKDASPTDIMYADAERLIEEAINEQSGSDDFNHIAGMLWYRKANAVYKESGDFVKSNDAIQECILKAIGYFEKCNELNRGLSPYGYASCAQMLHWYLNLADRKMPRQVENTSLWDEEPYSMLFDKLGQNIGQLQQYREKDSTENKTSHDFYEKLRAQYIALFGDIQTALRNYLSQFKSSSDKERQLTYGHRSAALLLYSRTDSYRRTTRRERFTKIVSDNRDDLYYVLSKMSSAGDLQATSQLFQLLRYTEHDRFGEGSTDEILYRWYNLAVAEGNVIEILKSSLFLYTRTAIEILNSKLPDRDLEERYRLYREKCRDTSLEFDIRSYVPMLFYGNGDAGSWDTILDADEACVDDRSGKRYLGRCRRIDGLVTDIMGNQGDCESGRLTRISFGNQNLHKSAVGRTRLYDGVLGFRYRGAGLYDFRLLDDQPSEENSIQDTESDDTDQYDTYQEAAASEKLDSSTLSPSEVEETKEKEVIGETEIYRLPVDNINVKINGKIDLPPATSRFNRPPRSGKK